MIKENVPLQYFAVASGLNNAFSMLSSALGQAVVGMLIDWHRLSRHAISVDYISSDYQFALSIIPVAGMIGWWVVTFKIKETYCKSAEKLNASYSQPKPEYQTS